MPSQSETSRDLSRILLAVLFFSGLAAGSFWILSPFLPALIWAATIVIATWPLMLRLQSRLWGRRSLAVALSTIIFLLLFVVPFTIAAVTIVSNAGTIAAWVSDLQTLKPPPPPGWLHKLPRVGSQIENRWQELSTADRHTLLAPLTPYVGQVVRWFVGQVSGFGLRVVHFLLTIVLSVILYMRGEAAASFARRFARRLAGERGEQAALLAAKAVRAVALGVVLTALVQSGVAGLGLAIAQVPQAFLLTALMFVLAVVQIGSVPVMLGVTAWLYWQGFTGWGTMMLLWTVGVGSIDNFLRPILIRRGANLPLLLIFAGVIGGLFAFGIIGLFVGPVILAVTFTLLAAWINESDEPAASAEREPTASV